MQIQTISETCLIVNDSGSDYIIYLEGSKATCRCTDFRQKGRCAHTDLLKANGIKIRDRMKPRKTPYDFLNGYRNQAIDKIHEIYGG